jgi:hypothetical protein
MIYMLKINALVVAAVFGFAGMFILVLYAWTEALNYTQTLRAMKRICEAERRDSFVVSRNHDANSFRAA